MPLSLYTLDCSSRVLAYIQISLANPSFLDSQRILLYPSPSDWFPPSSTTMPTCMGGVTSLTVVPNVVRSIHISFDMTVSRSELKWSITSESEGNLQMELIVLQLILYVFGDIFTLTGTPSRSLFKIGLLTASRYDSH